MKSEELERTFSEHKSTMRVVSYDDKNNISMVDSQMEVIDFDKVKEAYIKSLRLTDTPSSNDALVLEDRGRIFFVEFKNGNLQKESFKLGKKIYDSVLIFTDLTGHPISEMRKSVEYVLVYNETANPPKPPKKKTNEEKERNVLGSELMKLGGEELILFGLDKFQNYCFKAVHTYTVSEFKEYLNKN